jgi:hypothetical protein
MEPLIVSRWRDGNTSSATNHIWPPNYERVLDAVEHPTWILQGYAGASIAVLALAKQEYLHVVYREVSRTDGFIITAFIARKVNKRAIVWPKKR